MNKSELIDQIVERAGLNKKQASDALTATLDALSVALQSGDRITLVGFGTFDVGYRAARIGVNPRIKGEKLEIAEKANVKFKAGKDLATLVDNETVKSKFRKVEAPVKVEKVVKTTKPAAKTTTKKK
jgi:DNA-binding protein HU-beta